MSTDTRPPAHPPRRAVPHRQRLRHDGVRGHGRPVALGGRTAGRADAPAADRRAACTIPRKAKHVIFLFMNGGLSQVDSFDPKPMLEKYHGQPLPGGTMADRAQDRQPDAVAVRVHAATARAASKSASSSRTSASCVDDICVIRSMYTDIPNHEPSMLMMNTGHIQVGRPSHGLVAHLRPRHREPEPAGLRGAVPRRADHGRPAAVEQRRSCRPCTRARSSRARSSGPIRSSARTSTRRS